MIEVICRKDHSKNGGAAAGAVVAIFENMQDASNRGIKDSYPMCWLEYVEKDVG